ncbi:MAG: FtsH protease activity modulator HflK [Gallionellaceae bacterium]|jgi:membrane protease subunit HflK|nr:FtsH protease activity modulator HflK [Gallionellaceae bacterium]
MALNDPQWGGNNNKKNDGPPDLEAVLRDLNKKIASLFGGKKKGNGGGNIGGNSGGAAPAPRGSGGGLGIGLISIIAILIWVGSGFYIVDAGQRGVVLRFGKFVTVTEPGPRWHMPFPIESVEVVDLNQVRTVVVGYRDNVKNKQLQESLMLTDDENIIDIQFAVQYVLSDPAAYLFNNRFNTEEEASEIVRQIAETTIREVVGKNKMDFVLYEGREQVAAATTQLIQEILDRYKSGILVSKVTMQNAQPPEQVQAAFNDAVKAGQDRERQKNEGQAYANDVVPRAKGAAARLLQEADGYKQSVIANAEGDASRFKQILVEYEKAPQVTRERMYIDMMQQILSSTTKILVDQKNGSNLLYLPLDKLIQNTTGSSTADAAAPKPPEQAAPPAAAAVRDRPIDREERP